MTELGRSGAELTVRFLVEGTDLLELLADAGSFAVVVSVGGDGTASGIAYALRGPGVPLLVYPGGTANLLARNLRIPTEPVALAEAVAGGVTATLDLGELSFEDPAAPSRAPLGFAVAAGAGFDAAIMESAAPLKSTLGEGAYIIAALQHLAPTVATFTLELDGDTITTEGIAVLILNLGRIQFDLAVAHGTDGQDGLLDIVVVKTRNPAGLLPAIWAALLDRLASHPDRPGLEVYSASQARVSAKPALPLEYDGESLAEVTTPVNARILPRAATFIVPADSPLRS
jgi:diacylglycerol kinase family enzyme